MQNSLIAPNTLSQQGQGSPRQVKLKRSQSSPAAVGSSDSSQSDSDVNFHKRPRFQTMPAEMPADEPLLHQAWSDSVTSNTVLESINFTGLESALADQGHDGILADDFDLFAEIMQATNCCETNLTSSDK